MNGGGLLSSLLSSSASRLIWKCIISNADKIGLLLSSRWQYIIGQLSTSLSPSSIANSGFDAGERVNSVYFLFTTFSCDEDGEAADGLSIVYWLVILNANCRYILNYNVEATRGSVSTVFD